MVFCVYFDPNVISAAESGGTYALQCLIGILRGFEANCLLAEFDDYFVQEALGEPLNDLKDDNAKKALKSLFATLQKRNRFVYALTSRDAPPETRVADALLQGQQAELDLVLSEEAGAHPNPHSIPTCSLVAYNTTHFETDRAAASNGGRTFPAGSHAESDFLDWTLRKALKHCASIQVYDRLFGERFRGNFEYSAKAFIQWLETFVADPSQITLEIHCGLPGGNTDHFIRHQLASFRRGRLATMPITVQFYKTADGEDLPHQRFLITHQVAIDLGRGMDCLDPATKRNREGKFGFARADELQLALRSVPNPSLPPVRF
jgi:hypothetical protein